MGGLLKRDRQNSKLFYYTLQTYEILGVDNYDNKIIFDKIWGYQNKGVSLKQGLQDSNFFTTYARQMKFSE